MSVSEIANTVGATFAFVGTWATDSTANVWSSGTAQYSSTAASTCTITFSGYALYLLTSTAGTANATPKGGEFTVTVDGVSYPGEYSCQSASTYSNQQLYRVLLPICRGLVDGPHTAVLTVPAVPNGRLYVDSIFVATGARPIPTAGLYVCMGDSWVANQTGATAAPQGFSRRATTILQSNVGVVTLSEQGVVGDRLAGSTFSATTTGGMWRLAHLLAGGTSPQYVSVLFGVNDLGGNGGQTPVSDWVKQVQSLLSFLGDVLDTTKVRVAMCTPGFVSPIQMMSAQHFGQFAANQYMVSPQANYEACVRATRQVVAQYPWCRLGQVYEAMDYRTDLIYPNSNADFGNHPNDAGHGVVASEIARALLY